MSFFRSSLFPSGKTAQPDRIRGRTLRSQASEVNTATAFSLVAHSHGPDAKSNDDSQPQQSLAIGRNSESLIRPRSVVVRPTWGVWWWSSADGLGRNEQLRVMASRPFRGTPREARFARSTTVFSSQHNDEANEALRRSNSQSVLRLDVNDTNRSEAPLSDRTKWTSQTAGLLRNRLERRSILGRRIATTDTISQIGCM